MSKTTSDQSEDMVSMDLTVKCSPEEEADLKTSHKVESFQMMDPHAVLAYIFQQGIEVPAADVEAYWKFARDMKQGWAVGSAASTAHMPVGLWGDSATVFTEFGQYKIVAIFLSLPLWRPKNVKHSRFLLFCIEGKKIHNHETLLPIWNRITWSLNSCFTGKWPMVGPSGEPVQGLAAKNAGKSLCEKGHKFICTEIRGDWLWLKEQFRFPKCAWNANKICFRCPAAMKTDPLYTHHDDNSGRYWLDQEFDLQQFLRHRTPRIPCILVPTRIISQ